MKKIIFIFLFSFVASLYCVAQDFKLGYASNILKDGKEVCAYSPGEIDFRFSESGITIHAPGIGEIKLSKNLIFKESVDNGWHSYFIFDLESDNGSQYTKGFSYAKRKECSFNNSEQNFFSLFLPSGRYDYRYGVVTFKTSSNQGQNLQHCTLDEDKLIVIMKRYKR